MGPDEHVLNKPMHFSTRFNWAALISIDCCPPVYSKTRAMENVCLRGAIVTTCECWGREWTTATARLKENQN